MRGPWQGMVAWGFQSHEPVALWQATQGTDNILTLLIFRDGQWDTGRKGGIYSLPVESGFTKSSRLKANYSEINNNLTDSQSPASVLSFHLLRTEHLFPPRSSVICIVNSRLNFVIHADSWEAEAAAGLHWSQTGTLPVPTEQATKYQGLRIHKDVFPESVVLMISHFEHDM